MKIYAVKVFVLGADIPTTFYFESRDKAKLCYDAHQRADDIECFDADDNFPLEMLSDNEF